MMTLEAGNFIPTWPAMTNLLRNSRYMPRRGCSTREFMPCLSARWNAISCGTLFKHLLQSIDMPIKSVPSTSADSTDRAKSIHTSSARLPGLYPCSALSVHFSCRCIMSRTLSLFLRCKKLALGYERCQISCERNRPRACFLHQVQHFSRSGSA